MSVFCKFGRFEKDIKLSFKGSMVTLVEDRSYLGVKFKSNGNLFSSHLFRIEKVRYVVIWY